MIFSLQRYLEDYFERRGLVDNDQYAVKMANLYATWRHRASKNAFLKRIARVQTVFFRANLSVSRAAFQSEIVEALDRRFSQKKSLLAAAPLGFPGGLARERARVGRSSGFTLKSILDLFRKAVEARAIDAFWRSRDRGLLAASPEKVGQNLLAMFAIGVLAGRGVVVRELKSGVGFVDIALVRRGVLHLLELKVLRSRLVGVSQLRTYMKTEGRSMGWLVLFDARPSDRRPLLPSLQAVPEGTIRLVRVEIRPISPSRIREAAGDLPWSRLAGPRHV